MREISCCICLWEFPFVTSENYPNIIKYQGNATVGFIHSSMVMPCLDFDGPVLHICWLDNNPKCTPKCIAAPAVVKTSYFGDPTTPSSTITLRANCKFDMYMFFIKQTKRTHTHTHTWLWSFWSHSVLVLCLGPATGFSTLKRMEHGAFHLSKQHSSYDRFQPTICHVIQNVSCNQIIKPST